MNKSNEIRKIDNRAKHLREHAMRAKNGAEKLERLAWIADEMADLADKVKVSPSTRAWHHEEFRLDLWFNGNVPGEILTRGNEHFDEFALYGSSGHVNCSDDYDYYVSATVKVRYDP